MELKYRPEIDGLRALAVLPVIFFHAGSTLVPGGFLGVDVFFVISGFLITSILIKECSNNSFTFSDFYLRRIRRIAPALIVVIAITSVVSFYIMVPYDLKNYGQSIVASIFSANNILLYLTSGYWSTAAEFKPLYHTWSLAVEEQYYLIAPIIIWMVFSASSKNFKRNMYYVLSVICLISFIIACYSTSKNREFSFLMLSSRAWEIAAGGIAAIVHSTIKNKNNVLAGSGLLLVLISYIFIYGGFSHPGFETLLPVAGACLYLVHADSRSGCGRLMSSKILVFIGAISYSLYLWHQPIFAFIRLNSRQEPSVIYFFMAIPAIFLLSYASYVLIEKPFRNKNKTSTRAVIAFSICLSLVLSVVGLLMHKSYGFQKMRPDLAYGGNPQDYVDSPRKLKNREFSSDGKKILIMGNSYARDIINAIDTKMSVDNINMVYNEGDCDESNNITKELIGHVSTADVIIIANNWGGDSRATGVGELKSCVDSVRASSKATIIIIGTKNFGYNNNFTVHLSRDERVQTRVKPLNTFLSFNDKAKVDLGSDYVDLMGMLMDPKGDVRIFNDEGKFISYDTSHLTKDGAKYIAEVLEKNTNIFKIIN